MRTTTLAVAHEESERDAEPLRAPWDELEGGNAPKLAGSLRRLLASGRVRPGDPLPSGRELVSHLGLSRVTVRAALGELAREGLLEGSGTRIRRVSRTGAGPVLAHVVTMLDPLPLGSVDSLRGHPGWAGYAYLAAIDRLHEAGYEVMTAVVPESDPPRLNRALATRTAGAILPQDYDEHPYRLRLVEALREARWTHVVHCDLGQADKFRHCVCCDHAAAGRLLAEALLARGCRRPLRVYRGASLPSWLRRRDLAFDAAFREAGVEPLPPLVMPSVVDDEATASSEAFGVLSHALAGYLAPRLLGAEGIDAMVAAIDQEVPAVAAACRLLSRPPGEAFPISGYDRTWSAGAEGRFDPYEPCVTVDRRNADIGRRLAEVFLDVALGPADGPQRVETVAPRLVANDNR